MVRCIPLLAGVALAALTSITQAATVVYQDDFETGILADRTRWDFGGITSGATAVLMSTNPTAGIPVIQPTRFLGEFGGNDNIKLTVPVPQDTVTIVLEFDAYLLRSWDGSDPNFGGPDTFGYGYNGTNLLDATFSNGAGSQSYCPFAGSSSCPPTWGSDGDQKNRLGFNILLDPVPGIGLPEKGTPMSLVYHFVSVPIAYSGSGDATFNFFSRGLQLTGDPNLPVADESFGLDNFSITAFPAAVPEPQAWAFTLAGIAALGLAVRRRRPY